MQQKSNKIFLALAIFFVGTFPLLCSSAATVEHKLIIFFSPSCQKCIQAKKELLPEIEKKFSGRLILEYRDISQINNYKLLLSLKKQYNDELKNTIPVFYIDGKFLNGEGNLKEPLRAMINQALKKPFIEGRNLPEVDLAEHFKSFRLPVIISAGLIDGINPCAFSVIVFFISYLALQGYRKRELIAAGSSFIFALFVTYVLLGLGLFAFLYKLQGFWLVYRVLNYSIGAFSIILGIFAVYDFLKFRRTGSSDGLLLQLPQLVKNRIHSIIGSHHREARGNQQDIGQRNISRVILAAFASGFLVTILEAVCTGQTYLPTVGFILKATSLRLDALIYLLLYNLMFIVPLAVIFLFALLGVTSVQFSQFLKRHLLMVKALMAALFFSLGIFLLWRG
ncbi:MAG: hypothetical protein MUC39_03795 [Candidatus Omnitrophica bacterium]|jgi:cytochrome c biogenesis protein CcdA|nr:hypothetical protein [Candidatus Omnitrophota bacterium]